MCVRERRVVLVCCIRRKVLCEMPLVFRTFFLILILRFVYNIGLARVVFIFFIVMK